MNLDGLRELSNDSHSPNYKTGALGSDKKTIMTVAALTVSVEKNIFNIIVSFYPYVFCPKQEKAVEYLF